MYILLSLLLSFILITLLGNTIKKYKKSTYVITIFFSLLITYVYYSLLGSNSIIVYCLSPFVYGSFASALFIIVMYLGISKKDSNFTKLCMPIRSEISIIACITTFIHNISMKIYVHHYSLRAFEYRYAAIVSLVLLLVMIPLFITSFSCVRRKMKALKWKKLQRLAYVFYFLMYVHVLILNVPKVLDGQLYYLINVSIYSVIFFYYFQAKIRKQQTCLFKHVVSYEC